MWLYMSVCERQLSVAKLSAKRIFSLAKRDFLVANGRMAADFSSPVLKSAAHHACQQASAARQVLEHVICEDMQLAWRSGREADTVDSEESQARMKKTMTSEMVQI